MMGKSEKDAMYLHIMDAIERVHEENVFITNALLIMSGVDDAKREMFLEDMDKRFEDTRKRW